MWLAGGRVVDRIPSGETVDFLVEIDGQTCWVEAREDVAAAVGEAVELGGITERVRLYDLTSAIVHGRLAAGSAT